MQHVISHELKIASLAREIFCDKGTVLFLDCGSGYMNLYIADQMLQNYTHRHIRKQVPAKTGHI